MNNVGPVSGPWVRLARKHATEKIIPALIGNIKLPNSAVVEKLC